MDLFSTIGKVDRAEIQYEPNGRSRGTGVVQFDSADTAETAIGMSFSCLPSPWESSTGLLTNVTSQIHRLPVR